MKAAYRGVGEDELAQRREQIPVTLMMHGFWRLHDPRAVHIQQAMFLKNVALVGGALLLAQLAPLC